METLLDILDEAVATYGDRPALSLRRDDGSSESWSFRELDRRSRAVAWRLRALALQPGDRMLTWSPSTPSCPAVYFGAMRAGVVVVPLDLRMAPDAIERIAAKADAAHLAIGTGRDAPDPREAGLERFPTSTVEDLAAEPDADWPADWADAGRRLAAAAPDRPVRDHLHVGHHRDAQGRDAQPRQHRRHGRDGPQRDPRRRSTGSSRSCPCRTSWSRRSPCSTR